MSNRFWNFVVQFTPGTLAKAEEVNTNLSGVNTGLDDVASELDQSIQVTNAPGTTHISLNAAARALKILSFNAAGDIVAIDDIGNWQGNHAGSTAYNERDLVKDAAGDIGLNNIYRANTSFTSSASMATDSANWDLVVDVTEVEAAKVVAVQAKDDAIVAQLAAEAVYDNFDDRYLGAKAAEPALDNDGDALITGALFFHTAAVNRMKVYNGATWQLTTANAVDVAVADAGGYYSTKNVEFALQQNGAAILLNNAKVTNATHTGDVTGSGALTIANNAVTNAKAADMATSRIKGRNTAGTGNPEDLTGAQALTAMGINTTVAELNVVDGNTSAAAITAAAADRVVFNDNGTMRQVALSVLDTFFSATIKTLTNKFLSNCTATTQAAGNDSTRIATTAFVEAKEYVSITPVLVGNFSGTNQQDTDKTCTLSTATYPLAKAVDVVIENDTNFDVFKMFPYSGGYASYRGKNRIDAGRIGPMGVVQLDSSGRFKVAWSQFSTSVVRVYVHGYWK